MTRIDGTNGPRRIFSRKLILSTPSYAAARLVSELDSGLARLLLGIEYAPVSVVHTGFDRAGIQHPLDGSGFLLPRDSGYAPNGCLWMSSLFDNHAPPDRVLLTNYLGGAGNRDAAYWDRQRKIDAVMQMLQDLLGVRSEPEMLHIETHAQALPLYHGAYSQRLESIENRLQKFPGLYLEANYRGGVSVRDRILRAQRVASGILQQLSAATPKCSSAADTGLVKDFLPVASASR